MEEIKTNKVFLENIVSKCLNRYNNINYDNKLGVLTNVVENTCFVELKDKYSEEEKNFVTDNLSEIVDIFINQNCEDEEYNMNKKEYNADKYDIKISKFSEKDSDEIGREIYKIIKNSKMNTEKKKNEIFKVLENAFENKVVTIDINKDSIEKARKLEENIDILKSSINGFTFDNDYINTQFFINFTQKDGEKNYFLKFSHKIFDKELEIHSNDFNDFKDKIVDFIEKDIQTDKTKYIKKFIEDRKEKFEKLKQLNKEDFEINTNKDFKFEFSKEKVIDENISFTINQEKNLYSKTSNYDYKDTDLFYPMVNDKFSETSCLFDGRNIAYLKIDYLEKKNIEIIMKQIDENVKTETLEDMKGEIKFHTLFDTFSDKKSNLGNLMEHFDYIYQNRIENMEDEEKISLVERSSEFLGLKLNSNGKVQEFLNENENDYMDKINEVLEINKWNLYIEIKRDIEVSKENLKSNKTEINDTNIFNSLKRKYREEVKTDTLTLQEEFIENAIPILLKKDNMGLSRQEIENFYNEVPQETKNKLFERIDNYFKESSDTLKGFNNKKVFENQSYYFLYNDYDELHKIELPKEKSVKKEIKKEKNIEVEKEMDM